MPDVRQEGDDDNDEVEDDDAVDQEAVDQEAEEIRK